MYRFDMKFWSLEIMYIELGKLILKIMYIVCREIIIINLNDVWVDWLKIFSIFVLFVFGKKNIRIR